MSNIIFRMAAKTDMGCVRTNNEDNFQASANLAVEPMRWINNEQYSLGEKGALLVVADGMGGMNAGEVASEIAIETVREYFAPQNLTPEVMKSRVTIERFMKEIIVEADARIKQTGHANPESRGMGTTIVIAWILDKKLYVSWCGDSRAYIWNRNTGLFQISKDHSYVQELVDQGKISPEDAFDYPDSNIITRSLCDASPKAKPDCLLMPQDLCDGDIILLCSDGLNGMLRDNEIEQIIAENVHDMNHCTDALIHAALEAGGADNVTVALCQILSGGAVSTPARIPDYSTPQTRRATITNTVIPGESSDKGKNKYMPILLGMIIACVVICIAGGLYWLLRGDKSDSDTLVTDTTTVSQPAETTPMPTVTVSDTEEKIETTEKVNESEKQTTPNLPTGNKIAPETSTPQATESDELTEIAVGDSDALSEISQDNNTPAVEVKQIPVVEDTPGDELGSTNTKEWILKNGCYIVQSGDYNWKTVTDKINEILGTSFSIDQLKAENKGIKPTSKWKAGITKIKIPKS